MLPHLQCNQLLLMNQPFRWAFTTPAYSATLHSLQSSRSGRLASVCCPATPSLGRRSAGSTQVGACPAGPLCLAGGAHHDEWWHGAHCLSGTSCGRSPLFGSLLLTRGPGRSTGSLQHPQRTALACAHPPFGRELHVLPHSQRVGGGTQHHPPLPVHLPGVQVGGWQGHGGGNACTAGCRQTRPSAR